MSSPESVGQSSGFWLIEHTTARPGWL
jgi:hypothetical protein